MTPSRLYARARRWYLLAIGAGLLAGVVGTLGRFW